MFVLQMVFEDLLPTQIHHVILLLIFYSPYNNIFHYILKHNEL